MTEFEQSLASAFGEKMKQDAEFCKDIWSSLANVIWKNKDGEEYSCSFRYAGGLIAEIIGKGDYMDWYCSGPYATVSEEIEEGMKKFGWTWEHWPEDID